MDGLALTVGPEIDCLVRAAAAGDRGAFDQLVQLHADQVYRVALRMLDDPDDAEDVQQETFLQAYRRLDSFRGEAAFGTWLYTIAARLCLGRRRRSARLHEPIAPEMRAGAQQAHNPQDQLDALDSAGRVQRTLAALAPRDRLLIVLRYIEELNHEEIGRILGCSTESSRSRLARAKRLFRQHYERMN